ncbi:hypothetical protein PR202_gb16873 [Eleusine coracana subsp. coracana]|uniref:Serpin domain-containing protein n=1 Tax=Eleusine coracana subsp. coracana TaxID=191504 RepID=A0AAV5F1I5_ELECO|nr:hypothetical protein PR202_gb16873 [Eleusine coracana subsp. coracana]
MCVFLPDSRDGLPWLMDTMQSDPASFLRDHLPQRRISLIEFLLPKFKLSFSSRVDGVLRDMGIKAAFDVHEADLSDMCEGGASSLAVEKVFHKAVLEHPRSLCCMPELALVFLFCGIIVVPDLDLLHGIPICVVLGKDLILLDLRALDDSGGLSPRTEQGGIALQDALVAQTGEGPCHKRILGVG